MTNEQFNAFIRERITELLAAKKKSEHRASIELGKGDSYIRSITNGISSPSLKGLYDIIMYFEMTWKTRSLFTKNYVKEYMI